MAYTRCMIEGMGIGLRTWHTDDVDIKELESLAKKYRATKAAAATSRKALFEAIKKASAGADKLKQVEIVNATGLTREHIRRINVGQVKLDD